MESIQESDVENNRTDMNQDNVLVSSKKIKKAKKEKVIKTKEQLMKTKGYECLNIGIEFECCNCQCKIKDYWVKKDKNGEKTHKGIYCL